MDYFENSFEVSKLTKCLNWQDSVKGSPQNAETALQSNLALPPGRTQPSSACHLIWLFPC